jgi:hypothetical protein
MMSCRACHCISRDTSSTRRARQTLASPPQVLSLRQRFNAQARQNPNKLQ